MGLGGAAAVQALQDGSDDMRVLPDLSAEPQSTAIELVAVQPFELVEARQNFMRTDAPAFDEGYLAVLATEPEMLVRRQSEEHVLFVGDQPVERYNNGDRSGHVVVLIPGPIDLADAPVYFGEPALPEQLTAADRGAELELARDRGVVAFSADGIAAASTPALQLADGYDLDRTASYLIEQYSPLEVDVISGLRAERLMPR